MSSLSEATEGTVYTFVHSERVRKIRDEGNISNPLKMLKMERLEVGCEREVSDDQKGSNDEFFKECIIRLSWALVHSRQPEDVQLGIAMLEASVTDDNTTSAQAREKLYLLAVGYYRSGDHARSRELVEQCLKIVPDWRQALTLKKINEDRIKRDGAIGIGIAATAVGLIAGGIAAAVARKK